MSKTPDYVDITIIRDFYDLISSIIKLRISVRDGVALISVKGHLDQIVVREGRDMDISVSPARMQQTLVLLEIERPFP
jgi:hypothetical protein